MVQKLRRNSRGWSCRILRSLKAVICGLGCIAHGEIFIVMCGWRVLCRIKEEVWIEGAGSKEKFGLKVEYIYKYMYIFIFISIYLHIYIYIYIYM